MHGQHIIVSRITSSTSSSSIAAVATLSARVICTRPADKLILHALLPLCLLLCPAVMLVAVLVFLQPDPPVFLTSMSGSIATKAWQVAAKENQLEKVQDELHQVSMQPRY